MPLPSNVSYGKVTGRFLLAVGDGVATPPDGDSNPDGLPAVGKVTFKPSPAYMLDPTATVPSTIVPLQVVCELDADGDLCDPAGAKGVWLVATDDPDLNPSDWTYTVTIDLDGSPKRSFSIEVPAGATVDLATASPVAPSSGSGTVVVPGITAAEAAAIYETKAHAAATFVTFENASTGAPITGGNVTIKVDPTTHEIVDIVWEA